MFKINYTPKAPLRELSVFCRKLSFLLGASIPIKTALAIVAEQLPGRGLRKHLPKLNARVQQGESFSSALKAAGAFPAFFCGFVAIGEATAKLPQVMEQMADFYEDQAQTKDELTAALVYPVAVAILMLGVIIMAITFVLPGYSRIFAATGVPLPTLTRGLLQVSQVVTTHGHWIFIGIGMLIFVLILFFRSTIGRVSLGRVILRIPIIRKGVNFRLTQSLHLLLSAGLPVSQALPLTMDVMDNLRVKNDIKKISAYLEIGKPFWEALREITYIDSLLISLARIGEETGNLPQTIEKCQSYYSQDYKRAIKRLNKLIEPIITLILGIGLGIIMLAVILPTFELATVL
ncbi:MAG: type II secretion system F family protein [Defluviitaleaceae bacterium]|nr:type II secretion system F family protein [Defluviitaleaceae bacterium]